ncbi:MAG: 2OG-Fe(II) oxygenase [Pseudomonadales bacterium]
MSSGSQLFINYHREESIDHFNYYYLEEVFSEDELSKIYEIGGRVPKDPGEVLTARDTWGESDMRTCEIGWIDKGPDALWLYEKIAQYALIANEEMWHYDLSGFQDYLQYTIYYGDGGHYDWHADLGAEVCNRKITVVLQLSKPEEYQGGILEINYGSCIADCPNAFNSLIFFPSFLLHRVTPVTSGVRKSLVTWLAGPTFR